MHIVYAVTTCSDNVYRQLFFDTKEKPAFQSQKYHRLLIEGLAANVDIDVVANPPVNRSVMKQSFLRLPDEVEGGARYHYVPVVANSLIKLANVAFGTFIKTLRYAKKESVVIVDCLNRMAALSALLAARLSGHRCVGIVTDLPDMLGGGIFSKKVANFVIKHCTDYILLTEAMNDYIGNTRKPYVVLEGHADITMKERVPSMDRKNNQRVCMYAGGVSKQYGLNVLVEGFRKAGIQNTQLHIYGPGDYVKELEQICKEDSRIFYGGMLLNHEIVEKEMEATLLVNPRPTNEEFVKYSFPSKTMEYMASGTPVLTTVLPGMPKEYYPYVYLLEDESADGIAQKLSEVYEYSDDALFEKGQLARMFVLEERNNVVQAQKVLTMLMEKNKN